MRTQTQVHDEKGRFVHVEEGKDIPTPWTEVTAHFLDPHEKNMLELMEAMNQPQQDLVDMNFANAVQALVEWRGRCVQKLTEER